MSEVFVIGDTHFNHARSLKFETKTGLKYRDFESVSQMNEIMIENWNRVVSKRDVVWHLGDVYFGDSEGADKILKSLNGRKKLILGNHDSGKDPILQRNFSEIKLWEKLKWKSMSGKGYVLTHIPLIESEFLGMVLNIHGHVHLNSLEGDKWFNASCEVINFTPISISEIIERQNGSNTDSD